MLDIISVKKNPQSVLYTGLGVITKGTIIEVNVSELGLVTQGGKFVWENMLKLLIILKMMDVLMRFCWFIFF